MKVAFDEHVPSALIKAFTEFAQERQFKKIMSGITVERASDYAPKAGDADYVSGSDVPWIRKFAKAGGRFIISGDTRMTWREHERVALLEEGMIVFFFSSQWSQWKFFRKCALLMVWWPAITQKMKRGHKSKFWRIPTSWAEDGKLQAVSTKNPHELRVQKQKAAQARVAKTRAVQRVKSAEAPKQASFEFGGGK